MDRSWGFQEVEGPRFQESRHIKVVRLSALHTVRLYPQEKHVFLVPISVRGWVDSRTIVWHEGLCQWKTPVTPWGIEPTTIRFVVQCSTNCATACPNLPVGTALLIQNAWASVSRTFTPHCTPGSNGCFIQLHLKTDTGRLIGYYLISFIRSLCKQIWSHGCFPVDLASSWRSADRS